ncbi:MAG: hypothetical protein ACRYFS_12420 [Janthinobacterium lividum]
MKSSSKVLLWIALLLVFIVAAFVSLRQPPVTDQAQIAQQLETARAAGERQDVGGVMKIISASYHDSNVPGPTQLQFLLNKVRGSEAVKITQSLPVVTVSGDTATSISHLQIIAESTNQIVYSHDITLQWQREDANRFLIIPTKVWHVVSADYGSFGLE